MKRYKLLIHLLILVCVVGILTIPFKNKAFHIDDWIIIRGSEAAIDPYIIPYSGTIGYLGKKVLKCEVSHPPLIFVLTGLLGLLTGGFSEPPLHLFFSIFPLIAVIAMYFIARRFTNYPIWAALFLIATPGFIVMSHNIMWDIPMLSMWLAAIALFIHGLDTENEPMLVMSGFMATSDWLISYQGLFLIPLLGLYALLNRKRVRFVKSLWGLIIPILCFSIWVFWNFLHYGLPELHPLIVFKTSCGIARFPFSEFIKRTAANIPFIGGATIFPLFLWAVFFRPRKNWVLYCGILLFSVAFFLFYSRDYTFGQSLLLVVFLVSGFVTITHVCGQCTSREPDGLFLFIWFIVFFVIAPVFFIFSSVKYLLPLFPPLIIIFLNQTERVFHRKARFQAFCIAGIVLTALTGIAVAIADYKYADIYRKFVSDFSKKYKESYVWFTGEWGFRYYMEEEGYKYLIQEDNSANEGDIVVIPLLPCPLGINPVLRSRLRKLESIEYKASLPIRVLNWEARAGFYSNYFGLLPYSFSTAELEHFDIFKVDR